MKEIEAELREPGTAAQAEAMHRTSCAADPGYPDAIVACWKVEPCDKFAACVMKAATSARPSRPSPSDTVP